MLLFILALLWAVVLVPPVLRSRLEAHKVRSIRIVQEVIDFGKFGLGEDGVRHHGNSLSLLWMNS